MKAVITQGAEAVIIRENSKLFKKRVKKNYRNPVLDQHLIKTRSKREFNLLKKAYKIISIPKIYDLKEDFTITMEFLQGSLLKDAIDKLTKYKRTDIFVRVGESISLLHDNNIIHGDITTSNIILVKDRIYFIDFGLGFMSHKIEDKAVDIHLFKQAIESKHYQYFDEIISAFLHGYSKSKDAEKVMLRLEVVEKRGRYKRKNY